MKIVPLLGMLCSTLILTPVASAQLPIPIGEELLITSDGGRPAIALGEDGEFVVAFTVSQYRDRGVAAQRFSLDEGPLGGQFQVSDRFSFYFAGPDVATRPEGGFLVVWQQGFNAEIRGKLYGVEGNLEGPEFPVIANDFTLDEFAPDIVRTPDGGFLLAWISRPALDFGVPPLAKGESPYAVRATRLAGDGSVLGEFQVADIEYYSFGFGRAPTIASGADSGFVVAWVDRNVEMRRLDASGEPIGAQFQVSASASGFPNRFPDVAMNESGEVVVVWQVGVPGDTEFDAKGRRYLASGAPVGGEFRLSSGVGGRHFRPTVAYGTEGKFLTAWSSDMSAGSDDSDLSVQLRAFRANGVAGQAEVQVNTYTTGSQGSAELVALADGTFLVGWAGGGVRGQRMMVVEEPCASGATNLCLNQERFRVDMEWRDFDGRVGVAQAVPSSSDDSGLFWFFDENNWEVLVKVLDGCAINDQFWVFAAATTNVEYTLRVTDTITGESQTYFNPLGNPSPAITDTQALGGCQAVPARSDHRRPLVVPSVPAVVDGGSGCSDSATSLCLNDSRFELTVEWTDFGANTGQGQRSPLRSDDSGLFWFFDENNWEILVKVLDGCAVNDHFWVFAAASTDVEYRLEVRDTETGEVRRYLNPLGTAAPAITDTGAFAVCP